MQLRHALRTLAASPGFTAIAVITLALGIGINTVVFTFYEGVALKPIAARGPGELVRVTGAQDGQRLDAFTLPQYEQIRSQARSLAEVIASSSPQRIVGRLSGRQSGAGEALWARLVSENYFDALGVAVRVGRSFHADDNANDHSVAVISHEFWVKKLHADTAVLEKTIRVQGTALDIIGVAPADFAGTGMPPQMPDLWIPLAAQPAVLPGVDWLHGGGPGEWQVLARRNPGRGVPQVAAELEVLARGWPLVNGQPAHLYAHAATFFQTNSGEFETFGAICAVLMAAVGMILLIGSINLVHLLLARHAMREHEFAVRLALGASRMHLIRQLCTESVLLGLGGGAAGLLLSVWSCEWIRWQLGEFLQRISGGSMSLHLDLSPDWRIFAYAASVSVFTGIAVGVWPALKASRRDVISALKQASGGTGTVLKRRNLLLGAQVAACLVLLVTAGLMFRGVRQASSADPGFETDHLAVWGVDTRSLVSTNADRTRLMSQAVDRILALPEVASVAGADRFPLVGHGTAGFATDRGAIVQCLFNVVSDRYFEALGVPVLAGRSFTLQETANGAPVAVISDVAARRAWPGQDPIGRRIHGLNFMPGVSPDTSFTVVGVVKGVRSTYLSKADEAYLYLPGARSERMSILIRTRSWAAGAVRPVFAALASINPNLPSQSHLFTMRDGPMEIQRMMAQAPATVAGILGGLALLLASVGVLGLVSQLVTRRRREIAIRVALGAPGGEVIRLVLWQTLQPALFGSIAGLAGAAGVSALLNSMVAVPEMPDLTYGAGSFSPAAFSGALALLITVILAASWVPLYRATRIDPAEALRNE